MKIKDYKLSEIMRLCKKTKNKDSCVNCPLYADSDSPDKSICQELFGKKIPCEWRVEVNNEKR